MYAILHGFNMKLVIEIESKLSLPNYLCAHICYNKNYIYEGHEIWRYECW
jgi:hypothetical protein